MLAVAKAFAPKGEGFAQSCRVCKTSAALRAEWGCDGPSAEPWGHLACPFCEDGDASCTACAGTGQVPLHDCPNRAVTERESAVVGACARVELGILPDAGSWNDQAGTFVDVFPFVAKGIQDYRERALEKARREAARKR